MAQQDTGLGWSAESDWLVTAESSELGSSREINAPDFPNQPPPYMPNITTWAEKAAVGFVAIDSFAYSGSTYQLRITRRPDVPTFLCILDTTPYKTYAIISTEWGSYIDHLYYNPFNGTYTRTGTFDPTNTQDATTGLYYSYGGNLGWAEDGVYKIPVFSSLADALSAISVTVNTFYKQNDGYAVVCVARWKTSNGTELISPILISSNTEFVDMTSTGTGHNIAKFNGLLNGVRFFMAFWDIPGTATFTTVFQQIDLTDRGNMDLEQLFMTIISTSYAHVIIINSPDPYEEEGADSGEEGGDGEELEDDEMGISHHAIPAAINTGFCRIYCPSEQQLRDLSNFLWSAQYDLTAVKKLFANPMDSVLGLSAVPLTLSGANADVYLGGVDTEMSFPMVSYQSYQVPMGAITVDKRWGSYLDYDPYTKFSIFLPFIGFKDLSADDIMGKQIILDYDVDILSGACTARLQAGGNVLYQWSGQCSIQLPVTASNWNQVFQSATSAALSAGLAVATGTAGPVLAGALAAEGAQAIMGKPRIERGGTASGAAGWMGGLTPYLVRVTPEAVIPSDQNKFIGYPAFSSISLGSLTGYNEISSIHLEGIPATGAELDELEAILKGGVIF